MLSCVGAAFMSSGSFSVFRPSCPVKISCQEYLLGNKLPIKCIEPRCGYHVPEIDIQRVLLACGASGATVLDLYRSTVDKWVRRHNS